MAEDCLSDTRESILFYVATAAIAAMNKFPYPAGDPSALVGMTMFPVGRLTPIFIGVTGVLVDVGGLRFHPHPSLLPREKG